jgi:hypothetical protein
MGRALHPMHATDADSPTLSHHRAPSAGLDLPQGFHTRAAEVGGGGLAGLASCRTHVRMCCWLCRGSAHTCSIPNACPLAGLRFFLLHKLGRAGGRTSCASDETRRLWHSIATPDPVWDGRRQISFPRPRAWAVAPWQGAHNARVGARPAATGANLRAYKRALASHLFRASPTTQGCVSRSVAASRV